MAKSYTYPRVTVSHTAKQHSSVQPAPADTTVMFVPVVTKKGPNREIVAVHSLSEFVSIFGNLDYETNGQMALNLYNWLRNGGTAYVFRLAGFEAGTYGEGSSSITISTPAVKAKISTDDNSVWAATSTAFSGISYKESWTLNDLEATPDAEETSDIYYADFKYHNQLIRRSKDDVITTFVKSPVVMNDAANLELTADEEYYFYANAIVSEGKADISIYNGKENYGDYENRLTHKDVLFIVDKGKKFKEATPLVGIPKKTASELEPKYYGTAKYYGTYYNNLEIVIDCLQDEVMTEGKVSKKQIFSLTVYENSGNSKLAIEKFPRRTKDNYKNSILSSEFIGEDFDIESLLATLKAGDSKVLYFKDAVNEKNFSGDELKTDLDYIPVFWASRDIDKLCNPSETPIDIIFDAGYPVSIKKQMMRFINNANGDANRPDIVGIFDTIELGKVNGKFGYLNPVSDVEFEFGEEAVATNIALYGQSFLISDELFTSQNIFVTATYFLSKLIAYNDMNYGIQFPTAGIRRGILDDAEAIFTNPNADDKQTYFEARVNYAEKTPREYAFMSQRTHDNSSEESYTALSFLNNIRVLEKMKKELERLGRNYLFEFNDSITLTQLSSVLNKYVAGWISNRTLATGVVTVAKNPWSDEAVDVNLTIKFNGTIEVISVDITIE